MSNFTEQIIEHSYEYAKDLLTDTGTMYPFGAFIGIEGHVHPLEYDYDKKNMPTNEQVIEALTKYCKEEMENGGILAYGLTYEASVQLEEEGDFIETFVIDIVTNEKEQPPVYYYPYTIKDNKEVVFGEPFAVKRA
jgi:hypothetical protein